MPCILSKVFSDLGFHPALDLLSQLTASLQDCFGAWGDDRLDVRLWVSRRHSRDVSPVIPQCLSHDSVQDGGDCRASVCSHLRISRRRRDGMRLIRPWLLSRSAAFGRCFRPGSPLDEVGRKHRPHHAGPIAHPLAPKKIRGPFGPREVSVRCACIRCKGSSGSGKLPSTNNRLINTLSNLSLRAEIYIRQSERSCKCFFAIGEINRPSFYIKCNII